MQIVESKYLQFPHALTGVPMTLDRDAYISRTKEIAAWLRSNHIAFNRDYLSFDTVIERGRYGREDKLCLCYAFKEKHHALMFKLAFA